MRQGEKRRGKRRREKEGKMGRREMNVKRRGRRENEGGNEIGKREKNRNYIHKAVYIHMVHWYTYYRQEVEKGRHM